MKEVDPMTIDTERLQRSGGVAYFINADTQISGLVQGVRENGDLEVFVHDDDLPEIHNGTHIVDAGRLVRLEYGDE